MCSLPAFAQDAKPLTGVDLSALELSDRTREVLHGILEKASADSATRTPIEQQIGDYCYACMDEKLWTPKATTRSTWRRS